MQTKEDVKNRLTKPVSFRLGQDDYEEFADKAKRCGLSQADFFRKVILENRTEIIARPRRGQEYGLMLFALNRIDNELQKLVSDVAKGFALGDLPSSNYDALLEALGGLNARLEEILSHVDKN